MSTEDESREELSELLFTIYDHGTLPNALREADAILASSWLEGERARARTEALSPILEWIHHEPYEVSCERAGEAVTTMAAEEPQIAFIDGYQRAVAHVSALMTDHTIGDE